MFIALIHWRIRPDKKNIGAFLKHWKRRVSTTLRHSDTIFNEYFRLSLWVC